ncbi:hypothetical protein MMC29_003985, partial [Sticta canariensis]|nr:hypothetical protein [Sticta canariensis]
MSSMMLHPRRTRAYSNQSFSEKDVSKNLQRGSVQSMNTFSLRRLLGSDPSNYSSSSRDSPETSNLVTQTISKDDENGRPPSAFRDSVETMSEPLLSLTISPGNQNDHASGDPNRNFAQGFDTDSPAPASNAESGSNPEQHSGAILPSAPT